MLREQHIHQDGGFLKAEPFVYRRGDVLVQYWRSFEDLERFARDPEDPHPPDWRRFNRSAGSGGSVGIRHEIFLVEKRVYETIYANMPVIGLAKATQRRETALRRLGR
jgi:hypothetical protein